MSLQDWLTDLRATGELTDAEAQQLGAVLGRPKLSAAINDGLSRQADYTRKTQELASQRKAFEDERTKAQADLASMHANLEQWRRQQETNVNQTLQQAQAAQQAQQTLEASIRAKCAEWGIDPSEFGVGATPTVPAVPAAAPAAAANQPAIPQDWENRFASADDTRNGIIQAARIPLLMQQINAEHMKLFGQPLPDGGLSLYDECVSGGGKVSIKQLWEQKFDIPTVRQKKDDERRSQELSEAEQRGYQKAVSEHKIAAPRVADLPSPVLATLRPSEGERPSDGGVSAAVDAWRSGKYRSNGGVQ